MNCGFEMASMATHKVKNRSHPAMERVMEAFR
jgi:hypothetical protein